MADSKLETVDPVQALKASSVHERAAATRDLEKYGDLDVIDILVEHAKNDTSPAIRHNSADAISDILSRYRLPPNSTQISAAKRQELLSLFCEISAGKNNALFLIFACLGTKECFQQILAGLRDPRSEVRLGAAIGLLRFCQSAATIADQDIEQQVVTMLSDQRLTVDAIAHVARVCASVGYKSALPVLRRLEIDGAHGETIDAAQEKIRSYFDAPHGIWVSDGIDAGEFNVNPERTGCICSISASGAALWNPDVSDVWQVWDAYHDSPNRQMWFRRVGEPSPGPALQVGQETWYMATKADVDNILKLEAQILGSEPEKAYGLLAEALLLRLSEPDAKQWRSIGLLWMRAHDFPAAIKVLQVAIDSKRTPIDTWFYLGECHAALGDKTAAKSMWETCLQKTRSTTSALALLCMTRLEQC